MKPNMAMKNHFADQQIYTLFIFLVLLTQGDAAKASLGRHSFPPGFVFGTASSAYQYEGAARDGGRGPSIWDTFTHRYPEKIKDKSNGDMAVDFYHKYKEDIEIMKNMNLDAFRFSISWPRLLPNGKISGGVNKEGVRFYNDLIDNLLARGLQPFVSLFHWDLPQALEDEYGGFLSSHIVDHFRDYAELCFREFGDRVKHWITLNEPLAYSSNGYAKGTYAPGRCSKWQKLNCTGGDSGTEPYLVTHNQLIAHAAAVKIYKKKFQVKQKGKIGITLITSWFVPYSRERKDQDAAQRALDFTFGWFMKPLTRGNYPKSVRHLVGKRLPKFSKHQSKMVNGSFDFLGLNYYTTNYAAYVTCFPNRDTPSYTTDSLANLSATNRDGVAIGPQAASDWLYVHPKGLRDILLYTKKKYKRFPIYITENGVDEANNASLSIDEALNDKERINFYYNHLIYLKQAIKNGVDVRGYFAWSFLDDFEWDSGYTVRFGFNYVDFANGLKRYPKLSAKWFARFLKK